MGGVKGTEVLNRVQRREKKELVLHGWAESERGELLVGSRRSTRRTKSL